MCFESLFDPICFSCFEVMLKSDANQTTPKIAKLFQKWGIKLYTVDWDVPPNAKHYPKKAAGLHFPSTRHLL